MTAELQHIETERALVRRAVDLSIAAPAAGDLPFGAVIARGEVVLSEAHNEIASRCDPTAHAEVLAMRAAGERTGGPDLSGSVLYCSSEPCPMCLAACYWARIDRVVHAAGLDDAAEFGFADAACYRELALPKSRRTLRVEHADSTLRGEAVEVLRRWSGG